MNGYDYDKYTEADVRRALSHEERTPEDFGALLSPAALPLLEEIAQKAQEETRKHFGNSIYMFTPLLQTTAKIIAYTAALTSTTKSAEQDSPMRR